MKTCSLCKSSKPFDQYSKDKQKGDGYCSTCRDCAKARLAAYRAENPDKVRLGQKAHYATNQEMRIAKQRAYREANPEKVKESSAKSWEKNKEKYKAATKAWREAHKDYIKSKNTVYYAEHGHKMRDKINEYRRANPEQMRAYEASLRAANPAVHRAQDAKRRARKLAAGGSYTAADVQSLMGLQSGKCAVCRCCIKKAYHVDHIEPLARGGSNDRLNLQILCKPCNLSKSARDPIVFMQSKGFLL